MTPTEVAATKGGASPRRTDSVNRCRSCSLIVCSLLFAAVGIPVLRSVDQVVHLAKSCSAFVLWVIGLASSQSPAVKLSCSRRVSARVGTAP